MANFLKATYEPTKEECWVNMDYVLDVFHHGKEVQAYTFDNERDAYLIDRTDFNEWLEKGGE